LVGVVSGTMSGAFGMGGPPLVIYPHNVIIDKNLIRSTMLAFWSVNAIVQLMAQVFARLYTYQVLTLLIISLPINLVGVYIGKKLFNRLNSRSYKILVSILTITGGLILLFR